MKPQSTHSRLPGLRTPLLASARFPLLFAFLIPVVVLEAGNLQAQSPALRTGTQEQQRNIDARSGEHPHDDADAVKRQSQSSPPTEVSQQSAFQRSVSQTNEPAKTAIITWDVRGLGIEAWNSSLNQILREVTAKTGARLEGIAEDQRIFGSYGPGPSYVVLSQLLEGSGYNVLILESHDADRPLTIMLSARLQPNPQMRTRGYADNKKPVEPDQPPPDPLGPTSSLANQDPYNIGGPTRDPVQFMQEILQRQQLIDQQQQDERRHPPQ